MTAPKQDVTPKQEPGKAVARREPAPSAALSPADERAKDQRDKLKSALSRYADRFAQVLPQHLTPERMVTLTLVAATKNPKLFDCTPESIALSVMEISRWGLDIGRTAHLVPFNTKVGEKWVLTCTAIADWKGLVELLLKSGHVRDIKAKCVYANEHFALTEGTHATLEHRPIFEDDKRGEMIAAYAIAWLRRGGSTFDVLSKSEVDKIRAGAQSKDSPAWKNHYAEMAKKTAIRRLAKRLPQTPILQHALGMEVTDDGFALPDNERLAALQRFATSSPPKASLASPPNETRDHEKKYRKFRVQDGLDVLVEDRDLVADVSADVPMPQLDLTKPSTTSREPIYEPNDENEDQRDLDLDAQRFVD